MKVTYFAKKEGLAKLVPESLDDLYHLSKLAEPGDLAGAKSSRKIKLGGEQGRQTARREPCFVRIKVKKVELDYTSSVLRLSGEVENEIKDIPKGSAHALTIEARTKVELKKESWKRHHVTRLNKAKAKRFASAILVCSLDDDGAAFASVSDAGVRELGEIELSLASKCSMKGCETPKKQYEKLVAALRNFFDQLSPVGVVVASPGFWKDELFKVLKNKDADLAKKVRVEKVSVGGLAGVKELVRKGVSAKESSVEEEAKLVEELQLRIAKSARAFRNDQKASPSDIAKNGAVTYGFKDVQKAVAAVEKLAVSEKFVARLRRAGKYSELEKVIDNVEKAGGRVIVFDSKSEAGKVLDGLGGIAALLRYKV